MNEHQFEDKVVIVTGSSRGIGQAIACAFTSCGATVVGLARSDQGETAAAAGSKFHALSCDFNDATPEQAKHLVAQVVDKYGRLDALVNNAGIIRRAPAAEMSAADWHDVLRVNLSAPFFLTQATAQWWLGEGRAKAHQKDRLRIINIASLLSFQGGLRVAGYAAAKHGIAGLTKALANEWAGERINVNAVAPGYIATENTKPLRDDPVRSKAILERIPQGSWGAPADIAGTVCWLASGAADYVNGAVINVDGGWLGR